MENFKLPILHGTRRKYAHNVGGSSSTVLTDDVFQISMSNHIPLTENEVEHSARISSTPPDGTPVLGNKDADAFQFAFSVSSVLFGLVVTAQHGLKPCMLPGAPYLLPPPPPTALDTSNTQLDELAFTTDR